RWLGDYNHLTHAKGVAYPVFLALNQLTGSPLKLTEHILYLGTALYFCHMLGRVFNARWLTIVTFMLLAFNPAAWSPVVGGRVIREGLYTSLTLLMLALALRCYILPHGTSAAQALRKHWASLSLLGLVGGVFWLTREEGVWLLPSMGVLAAYGLIVSWRQGGTKLTALAYLGLPLLVAQVPIHTVNALNYQNYGVYRHNDFHSPDFMGAYGALSRIRHDAWQRYVVFPKDARERAYRFSAAARELKPHLEGELGQAWRAIGCEQTRTTPCPEILSGWFMWALRDAVLAAGHYQTAPQAAAFYRQLETQINTACDQSPGQCLPPRQTLVPPLRSHYAADALLASAQVATTLIKLYGLPIGPGEGFGTPGQLGTIARITHHPVGAPQPSATLLQVARGLTELQRFILRYGLPLALLAGLWCTLQAIRNRKVNAGHAVAFALTAAVAVRVLLLGFLEATSIPSNNMLYLSPALPLALVLVPLALALTLRATSKHSGHNAAA
ncbi:MAG: hypothetical protein K2X78_05390, partial [Burkholderiaceae bacterium]|nr:hypothetical protein [Burkholderiaceae bacterium]